jgi:uncharacterized protein YjbI with pentapeptide repeats
MVNKRFVLAFAFLVTVSPSVPADIYRWDNGQMIPGTEGIEPSPGVRLDHRDLSFAGLMSRDLTNANFSFSNLFRSDLTDANLRGADFFDASLYQATLTNANLSGANLVKARPNMATLTNTT